MTPNPEGARERSERLTRLAGTVSRFPPPAWRGPLLVLGGVIFLAGGVWSAARLELSLSTIRWGWLVAAAMVGVPLTIVANSLEYLVSARFVGVRVRLGASLRVAVVATAANLLPIPGGALVRVQSLRQSGVTYPRATLTTVLMGLTWVGVAALMAGLLMLPVRAGFGAILSGAGAGLLLLTVWLTISRSDVEKGSAQLAMMLGVELMSVLATSIRLYLILLALDVEPTAVSAALLALAAILASAIGVFPAGVGIKEILSAAFAPIVGLTSAIGFLAAALNRLVGMGVHGLLALAIPSAGRLVGSEKGSTSL